MPDQVSRRRWLAALAALLLAAATTVATAGAAVADPAPCTPYALPGLAGGSGDGNVMWINDAGMYIGSSTGADGNVHGVWWAHSGADLSTGWTIHAVPLPPDNTETLDVNASGVIVGIDDDTSQAWVYDTGRYVLSWLPDLPGGSWNWGRRINASGVVSGGAGDRNGVERATVWKPPYTAAAKLPDAGAGQSVGTQSGAQLKTWSEADGINDQGTTTGVTSLGGRVEDTSFFASNHMWRGGLTPLFQAIEWHANGQVERLPAGLSQGVGFAINNAGTVVGAADFPGKAWLSPAYWKDGHLYDMGASADVVYGIARGISQGGWVSGGLLYPDTSRAFVWTGSGDLQTLPLLSGFTDSYAHAVNDHFRQVGGVSDSDTSHVATVWQCPVGFTTG